MNAHAELTKIGGKLLHDLSSYRHLIGRLMYVTHTGPNIIFLVHHLSQFLDQLQVTHLQDAQRILDCQECT